VSLTSAQGFRVDRAGTNNCTGAAVGSGDINGDGITDLIIGAYQADPYGTRVDAGIIYVIYGKASGLVNFNLSSLTNAQGFWVYGAAVYDYTGCGIASGDINGDGITDLIIGAWAADPSSRSGAGSAYVIYGKASGLGNIDLLSLTSAQGFRVDGAKASDNSGHAVGSGDINGDGITDLIIGANGASPSSRSVAGSTYVIYGKASGLGNIDLLSLTSAQGFRVDGAVAGDSSGSAVGSGDINGDGITDLIISAYKADPSSRSDAGSTYVIYGKTSGLTNIDLASLTAAQGLRVDGAAAADWSGWAVGSGDINGDGITDLIIGAYEADPSSRSGAGSTYVIYGKASGLGNIDLLSLTSAQGFRVGGVAASDNSAWAVGSGDINGDGITDLIISAYKADPSSRTDAGIVYIISSALDLSLESAGITANLATGTSTGAIDPILGTMKNVIGSAYADMLTGDANANNIQGGAGDDVIEGKGSVDTLDGGAGTDTLSYASSSAGVTVSLATGTASGGDAAGDVVSNFENVIGSGYADTLTGDGNANNIQGGAGDDTIEGKDGADTLNGGAGTDTLSYASSSGGVTVSLTTGIGSGGDATGDIVSNFENVIGSGYADTLTGDANANNIQGGAGDDTIEGKDGADTLDGGAGTDTLSYSTSATAVVVDLSSNALSGGDAAGDIINNFENVIGSGYADTLTGDANANNIQGGMGDDTIEGKGGADTLNGGAGTDTLSYSTSPTGVTVSLTTGTGSGGDAAGDVVSNFEGIVGSAYADTLTGDANANNIQGGAGNDVIEGKGGADTLDGGTGTDTLSYASSSAGVTVSLAIGAGSGGDAAGDAVSNFENIVGSRYVDTLTGDANANNIQGGAGDDTIEGKDGADTLNGGAGTDTLSYSTSPAGVTVSLTTGTGSGGDAAGDIISNFENIIGSGYADTLTGDANANNIQGDAGNDTIEGRGGADMLDGGEGVDTLSYNNSLAKISISLLSGIGQGGDAEGDIVSNFENVIGSLFDDVITGDANSNNIQGNIGNDVIEGKGGADTLDGGIGIDTVSYDSSPFGVLVDLSTGVGSGGDAQGDIILNFENVVGSKFDDTIVGDDKDNTLEGGSGADILDGGGGVDTLSYSGALGSGVSIDLSGNKARGGDAEGDVISNFENLIGSSLADVLIGNGGTNYINGLDGDDYIKDGGGGNDVFIGGGGRDTFIISNGAGQVSKISIKDFAINEDKLDLSAFRNLNSFDAINEITRYENGACIMSLTSEITLLLEGVDPSKLSESNFVLEVTEGSERPKKLDKCKGINFLKCNAASISSGTSSALTALITTYSYYQYYQSRIPQRVQSINKEFKKISENTSDLQKIEYLEKILSYTANAIKRMDMLSNKIVENDHELTYTLLKTFGCLKCLKIKSPVDEIKYGLENIVPKVVRMVEMLKQISGGNDVLRVQIEEKFGNLLEGDDIKTQLNKLIHTAKFRNRDQYKQEELSQAVEKLPPQDKGMKTTSKKQSTIAVKGPQLEKHPTQIMSQGGGAIDKRKVYPIDIREENTKNLLGITMQQSVGFLTEKSMLQNQLNKEEEINISHKEWDIPKVQQEQIESSKSKTGTLMQQKERVGTIIISKQEYVVDSNQEKVGSYQGPKSSIIDIKSNMDQPLQKGGGGGGGGGYAPVVIKDMWSDAFDPGVLFFVVMRGIENWDVVKYMARSLVPGAAKELFADETVGPESFMEKHGMFIIAHFIAAANIVSANTNVAIVWKCVLSGVYTGGYVTKLAVKELHVAVLESAIQNQETIGIHSVGDFAEKCGAITGLSIAEGALQFGFVKFVMHINPGVASMIAYITLPTLTCVNTFSHPTELQSELSVLSSTLPKATATIAATTKVITNVIEYLHTDHTPKEAAITVIQGTFNLITVTAFTHMLTELGVTTAENLFSYFNDDIPQNETIHNVVDIVENIEL